MRSFDASILIDENEYLRLQSEIEDFYVQTVVPHEITHPTGLKLTAYELPAPDNGVPPLIIIPGRGEIAHKYAEFLYCLRKSRLRVLILFARGQGGSTRLLADRTRCHIDHFAYFRDDIEFMLKAFNVGDYNLLAFSLGGLISLDLMVNGSHKPLKASLIAPYVFPYFPVPDFILGAVIRLLGGWSFTNTFFTPHGSEYKKTAFEKNHHSHSKIRYEAYHDYFARHPEETIGGPTWGFLKEAYTTQMALINSDFEFTLPVFAQCAGVDRVVSTPVALEFFKKHQTGRQQVRLEIIENAYHDVLNEADEYRRQSLPAALRFLYEEEPKNVH